MNTELRENRAHGTPLFPFQMYVNQYRGRPLSVPLHWHEEIEVIHVLEGEVRLSIGEQAYTGRSGDVYIINAKQLHAIEGEDETLLYNAFVFPAQLLSSELYDLTQSRFIQPLCNGERTFSVQVGKSPAHLPQMQGALHGIEQLCLEKPRGYQLAVRGELLRFVGYLVMDGLLEESDAGFAERPRETLLRRMLDYLNAHSHERLTLAGVAGEFGLSPKYFCQFFKQNSGRSFVEYLNTLRVGKAANLLLHTDMKVMAVAMTVGYENFSYFIRRFKQQMGYTPAEYRKAADTLLLHDHALHL